MRVANFPIFTSQSMASSFNSSEISLFNIYGWSAQFVFTGSPVGTLKVQVSDDPGSENTGSNKAPTNWTDLANSSQSISAAGNISYNVNLSFYNWIRFVYAASSGSGSMTGRANLKGY